MNRSSNTPARFSVRRAILPSLAGLLLVAACVVNLDFNYTVSGQAVQSVNTGNTINSKVAIDLSQQSDIQAHKSSISSLGLNSLDLTVSAVQADNTIATVTGTVALRPDGATDASHDVLVGALNAYPITANSGVHLVGSAALDAFALSTVKGTGRCSAIISGTTTGGNTADFAVDIKLSLSMGYDTGI